MALNVEQWLQDNTWDLQGKVVVMTGAAGGLGSVTTRYLLQANANIIMLERDVKKMEVVAQQLRAEFPTAEIETIQIDFNHLHSVNEVVLQLADRRVDYLILNAGVYQVPLVESELEQYKSQILHYVAPKSFDYDIVNDKMGGGWQVPTAADF